MNIGLTNVQSTTTENASVSDDVMYNHPEGVESPLSQSNGSKLQPQISRISHPPLRSQVDVWSYPNSEIKQPTQEEFYQTYDPNVGLHTAAVLGGILVWLIIYLVYRTKCKKAIVRFFKGISEQRKEKKRASFHKNSKYSNTRMGADTPSIIVTSEKTEVMGNHIQGQVTGQNEANKDEPCDSIGAENQKSEIVVQKPPSLKTDTKKATAQWVREQPLSIQSLQELPQTSINFASDLTKLQLPNSCPPIRDPRLCKSSCGLSTDWNKSLPSISHNLQASLSSHSEIKPGSNTSSHQINGDTKLEELRDQIKLGKRVLPKLTITIPDAISMLHPTTQDSLNDKSVPIPVTPTVKIQNYTSKRSAHSSSLHRQNSDDSISSNSSDDPLLSETVTQNEDRWPDTKAKEVWPLSEKLKESRNDIGSFTVSLLNDKETIL